MRTILVKGLEWYVVFKSEEDIKHKIQSEYPDWKLDKVVKIPNNDKLMKLVCANVRTAGEIIGVDNFQPKICRQVTRERDVY